MSDRIDLVDSHAHLDAASYKRDLDAVVAECGACLSAVVAIGSGGGARSPRDAVALAERHPFIWAAVGVHPHEASLYDAPVAAEIAALARHPRVVAVGEAGLDYYYDHSPRDVQQVVLRAHVRLAREIAKPLVLHIRDAWADALAILREEGAAEVGGVVHCFTGTREDAEAALALGFHIGVTGIATYPSAAPLREVLRDVPLERLLVETDSPYLTPQAVKGVRPNRPALVRHVAEALAELRGIPLAELAHATAENTRRLFRMDAAPPTSSAAR